LKYLGLTLLILPLFVCTTSELIFAQVDPFEFEVFEYQTSGQGIPRLAWLNSYVPNGHTEGAEGTSSGTYASDKMYRATLEFSYGITNKIDGAIDLDLAKPNAASFQYAGSKFRLKGSLFEHDRFPLDLGWFTELGWLRTPQFNENQLEVELRPIIEKDLGLLQVVLNPKFEKAIFVGPNHNKGVEFGYAAGFYYRITSEISPGVEFYGGVGKIDDTDPLRQQQHYVFPVLRGELMEGLEFNLGPGIGLTRGSDRLLFKLNLEMDL
jgi:hypothetical protein